MKKALIAAALATSSLTHAEFVSGNYLYEQMTGQTSNQIWAIGYVTGVADAGWNVGWCPPPGLTVRQLYDLVQQRLAAAPALRHYTADSLIMIVLRSVYPCQQNRQRQDL